MKNLLFRLPLALSLFVLIPSCFKDVITKTYTIMRPVYEKKSTVIANVKSGNPLTLHTPGKIYIFGDYLLINEVDKGVHVFDNRNPAAPQAVSFINIPGNLDVAVKNNTLYADMYSDLLAIDIADPMNAKIIEQVSDVFPERNYGGYLVNDDDMMIVGWITKDTTVSVGQSDYQWESCPNCMVSGVYLATPGNSVKTPGIGGSMARFTIVGDYLYTVNSHSLGVFDITDNQLPVDKGTAYIGTEIETIYPFKNRLFIGSSSGMAIYNINNPASPEREGTFSHARACDPVIADDQFAFVTLRSGNVCAGVANQLDVLDVEQPLYPELIKTYPLSNPHGLAKDGQLLFVCDGAEGLKVYDATDVRDLKLKHHIKDMNTYDAIAWNNRLIVVASNGLYQYDYSNPERIELLSTIAVIRE